MATLEKDQMLSLAESVVAVALRKGAAEAEAYVYEGQSINTGIERGQVTKGNKIVDRGLGIRVIVNRAVGFAYTNTIEEQNTVEETVLRALSAARASKPDPDWRGLAEKKPYSVAEKIYDTKILELRAEDLVNVAFKMLDAATTVDKRVFPVEGGVGAVYLSNAIANSSGIEGFDQGTIIECSLATVAKEGSKVTPVCFEFNAERSYDIDANWVGKEAARLAVSALKTERIETKNTKLILTQFALQDLLYFTLINALKADNVQRGQSALKGKIGEKVTSENITIYDDGLFPGGLRTATFDGEGAPHQKTLLIEKGILRNFLYDNYTAKKENKASTGNAVRAGYLSTPFIESTNFHIIPGEATAEELISEVDDGLIIYYLQGAHSSNPVSGEFSVVATPAWKIKKGEITRCSRGVMLAGNIFEALNNVSALGSNERKMGQLIAPWLLVENVKVIGK
ncbi:MAG: TldD/PmbA family protein [Candidatus Bathyarchaeota archaeon]|nr:TldD/PmbA family protein [Candidatus Bathyarchaeota archaeon]